MAKKKSAAGRVKTSGQKVAKKRSQTKSVTKKAVRKRTKKRTSAKKKKGTPTATAPAATDAVTIRMYCQGLGDCFLLRFPGTSDSPKPVFVMIDCGVIIGTKQASEKMSQVVEDIIETTNGQIDVLVVTHEHWDHVSAFVQLPDKFKDSLSFGNVWLAWTEQPGHPVADKLRQERQERLRSLRAALTGLLSGQGPALSNAATAELKAAEHVLDFFGPPEPAGIGLAAAGRRSTAAAMQYVASLGPDFLSPGNVKPIPGTNVQAFVLGPPLDEKLLKKDAPSKSKDHAYELLAALAASPEDGGEHDRGVPFARRYQVSMQQARHDAFFRQRYGFADDPLGPGGTDWQRIDEVWLQGASQLALKLDSDTNNTSLVLAFELPDGRTLIFPGDAQIGNWLSWETVKFPKIEGRTITSQDLLQRAVVYKVGHHGSHNATLKSGGLEAMTSCDLVALIPVNEAMAKRKRPPKTGWKMPFDPLYNRLRSITGERILRADRGASVLDKVGKDVATDQQFKWRKFRQRVRFATETLLDSPQPLYVEYTL